MKKIILFVCWVLLASTNVFAQESKGQENIPRVNFFVGRAEDSEKPGRFLTVVQINVDGPTGDLTIKNAWVELIDYNKKEVYARRKSAVNINEGNIVMLFATFEGWHTHAFPGFILEIKNEKTGEIFRTPVGRPLEEKEKDVKNPIGNKEVPEADRAKKPPVEKPADPKPKKRGNGSGSTEQVLPV